MGTKLDEYVKTWRGRWPVTSRHVQNLAKQDEADLRAIIRDGVAMLEETFGSLEEHETAAAAIGEELGQPWEWLKRAKVVLGG